MWEEKRPEKGISQDTIKPPETGILDMLLPEIFGSRCPVVKTSALYKDKINIYKVVALGNYSGLHSIYTPSIYPEPLGAVQVKITTNTNHWLFNKI